MTRDEISAQVQENLDDAGVFYNTADFNDSIQDGYDDVAAFTGTIKKAVVVPFQANLSYYNLKDIIPDYLAVTAIFNREVRRWMFPTTLLMFDQIRYDWEKTTGVPFLFAPLTYSWIAIYPKTASATGEMYVFYRAAASTLAGGDSPNLQPQSHSVLVDYATADLLEQQQEYNKALLYWTQYTKRVDQIKQQARAYNLPDKMHLLAGF